MNFVRFKKYIPTNPEMGVGFAEGSEYLMASHEIAAADRVYVGWRDYAEFSDVPADRLYTGGPLAAGSTIGFYYPGGIGDGAVCTSFVHALKAKYPDAIFRVWSKFNAACVWYQNPEIEGCCSRPVPMLRQTFDLCEKWMIGDAVVYDLVNADQPNVYDVLSEHFNVPLDDDQKRPFIHVEDREIDRLRTKLNLNDKKLMVIAPFATKANRSWPHWKKLQLMAAQAGYETVVLSCDGRFSARELVPLAKIAEIIVSVDTSMMHLGAAFDTKTVAIFGPFSPSMRATTYRNCFSMWAKRECEHAPCCHHDDGFPKNCSTRDEGYCGVMEVVTPVAVMNMVKNFNELAYV